jgi:hypothetical protein
MFDEKLACWLVSLLGPITFMQPLFNLKVSFFYYKHQSTSFSSKFLNIFLSLCFAFTVIYFICVSMQKLNYSYFFVITLLIRKHPLIHSTFQLQVRSSFSATSRFDAKLDSKFIFSVRPIAVLFQQWSLRTSPSWGLD